MSFTAIGVACQLFLIDVVVAVAGMAAAEVGAWASQIVGILILPLGILLLAFSPLAGILESGPPANAPRTLVPPVLSARQLAWAGVFLTVLGGVLLFSVDAMLGSSLGTGGDLSANLARDLLFFVGIPLKIVCLPLGLALLPCSLIAGNLEALASRPQPVHRHG